MALIIQLLHAGLSMSVFFKLAVLFSPLHISYLSMVGSALKLWLFLGISIHIFTSLSEIDHLFLKLCSKRIYF